MAYRFVQDGDYVDFYDGAMRVIRVHKHSRCMSWIWDDTPGLNFKVDQMLYHVDNVGDISFNDVAITTQEEFRTNIIEFFPDLAGAEGSGALNIETAATFAAIEDSDEQRLVIVTADETNNGDKSLYIHDGTDLLFLQTIAP